MKTILIFSLLAFFTGCATHTHETDRLSDKRDGLTTKVKIKNVPFIKQDKYLCGPASIAMVLNHYGKKISVDELTREIYTKKMKGTFQTEMVSTVRAKGLIPIPVKTLENLLKEVSAGNPVIVFQNLGLNFMKKNHYAVATGYDLDGPDIILHSGKEKYDDMDMRLFERSWILGGKWALLALPPDKEPVTTDEFTYLMSASSLEETGEVFQAQLAYQTALKKWPNSLPALMGLSNVNYQKKRFSESLKFIRKATARHPNSPLAWHNRAYIEDAIGNDKEAKSCSNKALQLADKNLKSKFATSLKKWL